MSDDLAGPDKEPVDVGGVCFVGFCDWAMIEYFCAHPHCPILYPFWSTALLD